MAMKLYHGGFGDYQEYAVAENEADAIAKVGFKINASFLPITVEEISEVDGFEIRVYGEDEAIPQEVKTAAVTVDEKPIEAEEVVKTYHCKHIECDFTAHSPIELAQHSRKEHPKGD